MTTLDNMEQALGRPSAILSVPLSGSDTATIGRWKHGDAEPRVTAGDGLIKLVLNLSNTQIVEKLEHGVWTSKPFGIGCFSVVPPDEDVCFSVKGEADVLQVFVPGGVVALEDDATSSLCFRSRFQDHDPLIERQAFKVMVAALHRDTIDDLRLVEALSGLASVLQRDAQPTKSRVKGGLPPHRLRRVMDFIAASINGPEVEVLSLEQLAAKADLSPFHFARSFRETVGLSPYEYVLRKRLERARATLAKSSLPVANIGRQVGFRSHAHFSSQFRKQMGVSPASFRRAVHG